MGSWRSDGFMLKYIFGFFVYVSEKNSARQVCPVSTAAGCLIEPDMWGWAGVRGCCGTMHDKKPTKKQTERQSI